MTLPGPARGLIPGSSERPAVDPIFALDAEARRRAAAGESILNATLGALMEDDGRLAVMPAVFEAFDRVDRAAAAAYAPISGPPAFLQAVLEDVFGDSPLRQNAVAVATAGGTGAIHHTIANFLERGQSLLTTSYFWAPYGIIATDTGRGCETFSMFDAAGRFDVPAMEKALAEQLERQGRALLVLNFPCHNPTGFSLDSNEWTRLVEVLRSAGERAPVTLLVDLAYARYGAPGWESWVEKVQPLTETCTLLVAWSASKAFAQYGARVGALVAVSADPDDRRRIASALAYSCRATWSNCNHMGMLAIGGLLSDPERRKRVDAERDRLIRLLRERVDRFNAEAARHGLRTPRYEGGFFVAVFTEDPVGQAAKMREKGVFVVPLKGALRVAMCSTPADQIERLVAELRAVQD
jgi:aromatic-amino-acid transaminase